jgi:type I restriction enzyme S subunit
MPEVSTIANRASWTTVAFGDVVQLSKERSSDPEADGHERYIGLEHIDPGELRVRRWGNVADGVTFTSVFRPGQVLFGKRRAYQRKVAIADFSGVCSGDIYVLEPTGDALLPELLPFICQTDAFFEHAVGTSAGSLSPRTNWKSLASFEFTLPPIEEQRRMLAVLSAARTAAEALSATEASLAVVYESWVEARLTGHDWPERPASDLLDRATVGIVVKPAALYVERDGVPALRSLNVLPNRISWDDCVQISEPAHSAHRKSALHADDVVIVRSGRPGDAAVIPAHDRGLNAIDLIVSTPGPSLRSGFFCRFLNSRAGRRQFASGIAGTAQLHFNVSLFKKLLVPVPSLSEQAAFEQEAERFDVAIAQIETRIRELKALREALLEECVRR